MSSYRLTRWLPLVLAAVLWAAPCLHSALPIQLNSHDFSRLLQLGVLLVATLTWMFGAPRPPSVRRLTTHWPVLILSALVTASTLHAAHPLVAAREVALFGGLLILTCQLARAFEARDLRDHFLGVAAVGAAAYGAIWLLLLLVGASFDGQLFAPWEIIFGFDNARFLNHAQSIALPLTGVVLLKPDAPRWLRLVAAIALITGGAILTLYLARASVLALLAGATVTVVLLGRTAWRYVGVMTVTLGAGAIAMGLLWYFWLRHFSKPMTDGILNSHFRGYLVQQAFDLFASSPWLGVGPMHFSNTVNRVAAHPHNVYVQTLAEYGLPATLLFIWLTLGFLGQAMGNVRRLAMTQPVLAAALIASTVAMLIDSAFSGNWVMPIPQMWIAVLAALLLAARAPAHLLETPRPRSVPARAVRAAVLVAMTASTMQALAEARDPLPHICTGEPMKKPIGGEFLTFRFWSYGWF